MPYVTNKKTGIKYPVNASGLKTIRANRMTRNLFEYQETIEPDEVQKLKSKSKSAKDKNVSEEKNK